MNNILKQAIEYEMNKYKREYFDFEISNNNIKMEFYFFDAEKYFRLIISLNNKVISNTISEYKDYNELKKFIIEATIKFEGIRLLKTCGKTYIINNIRDLIEKIKVSNSV